ncbi:MAG: aminopeptidase [Saprospiraceae bacterium]|nr:aminopeptidase [Bacteroidia bacterium]NNE16017.1 aminopeptidase [Saprospiraceae bacterium]
MESILEKYAKLLCHYSLELKPKEKLYISTTTLAEPLVREIFREATKMGVHVEVNFSFREQGKIFLDNANEHLLSQVPSLHDIAIREFDAYLNIRAPFNLNETNNVDASKRKLRTAAMSPINKVYFERTADRNGPNGLKRSLCQYPTQASAQAANMSLEEYQQFVFNACHLFSNNPEGEWLKIRAQQQHIKEYLDKVSMVRYKADHTDISFSVEGRTWINSDGQTNMPSGEVFSGPVEDSVNGKVHFTFASIYMGQDVQGITLWVENGEVVKWDAEIGKQVLDEVFKIPGAKYFGEVAIGTNYNIQQTTRNILFDEKIGGTIHMAVGQSYKQTGGKNQSGIHWDMITDMSKSGQIFADDKLIYEKGKFLI